MGKALKFILDGFASIMAFLLFSLGLWLPAVFALIYIIAGAAMGVSFSGNFLVGLYAGLVLTFLISLSLTMYIKKLQKNKLLKEKRAQANLKVAEQAVAPPQSAPAQPTHNVYNYNYNYYGAAKNEDLDNKYFGGNKNSVAEKPVYNNTISEPNANIEYNQFGALRSNNGYNDKSGGLSQNRKQEILEDLQHHKKQEVPMIFATRLDPDLYIYEYSDRLEFYRKTKKGMVFIKVEYKTA